MDAQKTLQRHTALKKRASLFSVCTALMLAILKLAVGISINSLAIIAMAIDSILDIIMSAVNFVGIRYAARPADPGHPFGHGKFETLAALFQGLIILGIGIFIAYEGISRLGSGEAPVMDGLHLGLAVMAFSVVASFILSRYLLRVASTTDSLALRTDSLHYATDVWTNGGVMVALGIMLIAPLGWIDPVISIIIALYIIKEALPLLLKVFHELTESALPQEQIAAITEIVGSDPSIIDMHDLRTRRSGSNKIMDMHITVCRHYTLEQAHDIAHSMEERLQRSFAGASVVIHVDPCVVAHCKTTLPGTCPLESAREIET
ncbi:cation diffusion facilitator family transporter [Desulfurispira natronophila]|uniref:Cation diffusion facilitator family transporter n=1 Tax=Desulfurispira natronophila TaxID=682562 RepID=A0A7W7Y4Q8_9BACT|nr:cation diffusion facilitator family transporter [Desulfurispira natronophila]MBB5021982.1 cation diffusion facilitator family transporter [Desulfurispira natronophila]